MAGRLNHQLGIILFRRWVWLGLTSTKLTCRTTCSYLLAGKMYTVDTKNNCNRNNHAHSCSGSATDRRQQWPSRVKRHMSTAVKDANICQARSCLSDSEARADLLTFLASTARPMTVQECCDRLEEVFRSCGISEPDQSTEYVVAHLLGHKTVSRSMSFYQLLKLS